VPIKFDESADRTHYSLEIPAILQEQAALKRDKSGEPSFTMTAMVLWSNTSTKLRTSNSSSTTATLAKSWDHSENCAKLKYFTLIKQMYADRNMLGGHRNSLRSSADWD
jgi:hypothetical protein